MPPATSARPRTPCPGERRVPARAPALILAACVLWVAAAPAGAATVSVAPSARLSSSDSLRVTGAPGEASHLTVSVTLRAATVTDAGGNVTPGAGCPAASPRSVTCTAAAMYGFYEAILDMGDGDDQATVD